MAQEGEQCTLDRLAQRLIHVTGLQRKAERLVWVLERVVAWAE